MRRQKPSETWKSSLLAIGLALVGAISLCSAAFPAVLQDSGTTEQGSTAALCQAGATPALRAAGSSTVPRLVSFSGILTDSAGKPATGSVGLTLSLYEEQNGGSPLWVENQNVTLDQQGHYTVLVGSAHAEGLPLDLFTSGQARWLGVQPQLPAAVEQPRVLLVGMPYALKAADADTLGGKPASAYLTTDNQAGPSEPSLQPASGVRGPAGSQSGNRGPDAGTQTPPGTPSPLALTGAGTTNYLPRWTGNTSLGNSILFETGNTVGVGTTNPYQLLTLNGTLGFKAGVTPLLMNSDTCCTTGSRMMWAHSPVFPNWGIFYDDKLDRMHWRQAPGAEFMTADFTSLSVGIGTTTPRARLDVAGNGAEVLLGDAGCIPGFAGIGFGSSLSACTNYSLLGDGTNTYINRPAGGKIAFRENNTEEVVILPGGELSILNPSEAFRAVANDVNNANIGVVAEADGPGGLAVDAAAFGTNSIGVSGTGGPGNSYGVFGSCQAQCTGYAGEFAGNVDVSGNLSKSGGSFKIDHPADPANQYLYHSFVESPDMMNIYNGQVALDAKGEAIVHLPDWFEALNRDFRYQLTAIGGPGPNLYIAQEVQGNAFKVAGGRAELKVSWQVTGIRHDAWANAHRIPVEERKADAERGYYIHPELFGAPESNSIESSRHPRCSYHPGPCR